MYSVGMHIAHCKHDVGNDLNPFLLHFNPQGTLAFMLDMVSTFRETLVDWYKVSSSTCR